MKHCPYCGETAQDQAKFCVKCGRELEVMAEGEEILRNRCAKCGYQPPKPSRFCTHCGASMVVEPPRRSESAQEPNASQQQPTQESNAEQSWQAAQQPFQQPPVPEQPFTPPYAPYPTYVDTPQSELKSLCSKLKISAVLLLIAGCFQAVLGLFFAIIGIVGCATMSSHWDYIAYEYYYSYTDEIDTGIAGLVFCIIMGLAMIAVCIPNFIYAAKTFSYGKQIKQYPVGIIQHFRPVGKLVALLIVNVLAGGMVGIVGAVFALVARMQVQGHYPMFQELERQASSYRT